MITQVQVFQRMFNSGAYATSYLIGAFILFALLNNKKVGHRMLLRWGAWYLLIRSLTLMVATVAIYQQSYDLAAWLSSATALMSFVLFTYFFSVRHDVETTLEESEHGTRVNNDKLSDVVMAARNLNVIARSQRESLRSTLQNRRRAQVEATRTDKKQHAQRGV